MNDGKIGHLKVQIQAYQSEIEYIKSQKGTPSFFFF